MTEKQPNAKEQQRRTLGLSQVGRMAASCANGSANTSANNDRHVSRDELTELTNRVALLEKRVAQLEAQAVTVPATEVASPPADRKAYMRDLMRKKRAKKKADA